MSPARLDPAGAWRVSRWESPATHYPRRRVGRAAVETYTQAPGYYRFYGLADPAGRRRELYRTTRALPLTQLTVDGETWMVDDPPHLTAVREFAHEYRGHVLCAGLGLGLVAHALLDNPAVAAVTLVERDPDVAALVGPLVAGPRVRVVVADWWGYDPAADPGFAVPVGGVFFDILRGDAGSPVVQAGALREGKGYGGFPVGGQWLKCLNQELVDKHFAKLYGKASVGSPPMSVPHVDTRHINGKKELLFGPFAGFSTKFLKNGSWFDLPKSIQIDNVAPMLYAGLNNVPLTKYLIQQVRQSPEDRLAALREYVPYAKMEDWELQDAGQRVQVIRKDEDQGGVLEFGTEVIVSEDGSIAALLGASPGASTAVGIMLGIIPKCFREDSQKPYWKDKLKEMVPSYRRFLREHEDLVLATRERTHRTLGI
jgi:hypothetical protein